MKIFHPSASSHAARLICTSLFVFTLGIAGSASAQPKMSGKNDGPRMDRTAMMSKRMFAAIEEKTGKPLTATQKQKLTAAFKARIEANKVANDKFMKQVSSITGLKPTDFRGLGRGMRGDRR